MAKFKRCTVCSTLFEVSGQRSVRRYCSNACKQKAYRICKGEERAIKPKPTPKTKRYCDRCFAPFESEQPSQRYCSNLCRQAAYRARRKAGAALGGALGNKVWVYIARALGGLTGGQYGIHLAQSEGEGLLRPIETWAALSKWELVVKGGIRALIHFESEMPAPEQMAYMNGHISQEVLTALGEPK